MNRQEWLLGKCKCNNYYKQVQKLLKEWKLENNIQERCVVHHRDDTEECRKYNEEHYERWGCNEDGTFEYGKYVAFMTDSKHARYHNIGKHHSEETKEKLRLVNKGKRHSEETKEKMSRNNARYFKGKHLSEETKNKISNTKKGQTHTEETKAKMSIAKSGSNHPFYGKHHSEESKAKMSATRRGKHHSEETKEKMSAALRGKNNPNYGKHLSEETKAKMRAALRGKHHSEETKAKMSNKQYENIKAIKLLYNVYKNNNGTKKWNEFQKALKDGDITFSDYKITVTNDK